MNTLKKNAIADLKIGKIYFYKTDVPGANDLYDRRYMSSSVQMPGSVGTVHIGDDVVLLEIAEIDIDSFFRAKVLHNSTGAIGWVNFYPEEWTKLKREEEEE